MAALISSVMSTKDKVPFFVNRCDEMGIEVLPPDVNSSEHGFVVCGNSHPLRPRRGQERRPRRRRGDPRGARGGRRVRSLWDFCERVDARAVNKRAVECLIKCGALDSTGATRARRCSRRCRSAQAAGQKAQEDARARPGLDLRPRRRRRRSERSARRARRRSTRRSPASEFDQRELLRLEKETLGTFLSSHPLAEVRDALRARVDCRWPSSAASADGALVTVGGIVTECKRIRTKRGDDDDVRDPRRPRGPGRDARLATPRRARPRRIELDRVVVVRGRVDHKERGRDQAGRPGGRAVRARRGRGRGGAGEARASRRAGRAADRRRRLRRRARRRAEVGLRRTSRARPR